MLTPLYVVKHPLNGHIYVSDRRTRRIDIFDGSGKYLGIFAPKLPKAERPTYTDIEWAPIAMAFAPDGTFYVTELLKGHRLLIFSPDGKFQKSVGDAGMPKKDPGQGGGLFQFPNSIKVLGDEVWVADSNNKRVQVFDRKGGFKRVVVTAGLPRGFDFLPQLKGRKKDAPALWTVVDTLAHDATIWDVKGRKLASSAARASSTASSATRTTCPSGSRRRSSWRTPTTHASRSGAGRARSRPSASRRCRSTGAGA